jgi:hypothetical protein
MVSILNFCNLPKMFSSIPELIAFGAKKKNSNFACVFA